MSDVIYNPLTTTVVTKNRSIDIELKEVWVNGEKIKFGRAIVTKHWIEATYEAYNHVTTKWERKTITELVTYKIHIECLTGFSLALYLKEYENVKDIKQLAFLGKSIGYANKDFIGNMILLDYETKSEGHRPVEIKATFVANLTEVDKLV